MYFRPCLLFFINLVLELFQEIFWSALVMEYAKENCTMFLLSIEFCET